MVGKMMSLPEEKAYPLLLKHDVDYVLVIFGGLIGFSGDDINKFLWMVRISEGIWVSRAERTVTTHGRRADNLSDRIAARGDYREQVLHRPGRVQG
jgi:asparagine N-glycosylation enzyme membrane subunit Stt3